MRPNKAVNITVPSTRIPEAELLPPEPVVGWVSEVEDALVGILVRDPVFDVGGTVVVGRVVPVEVCVSVVETVWLGAVINGL